MRVKLPLLLKAVSERVKRHVRDGKPVQAYTRTGKPRKPHKMALRATFTQMQELGQIIEKNIAYLVYMGKEIAFVHGLQVRFDDGQPVGDIADLISEGKQGMLIGGMEAIKSSKKGDLKLQQMKTRAKQQMRSVAKEIRGTVRLPRDVIRHLAIISSATEKYMNANEGEKPSREDLAEMIILHRRTREGEYEEMTYEEKMGRIEALEEYKGAQITEELDIRPSIEETDVRFWTVWTREERQLREITHRIINDLVEEGALTPEEKEVLFLRFYVDKPQQRRGMGKRTFETIAKMYDERRGLKKLKVRRKVGDTHRFRPYRKIRHEKIKMDRKTRKRRKYVTYTYERYKNSLTGHIISIAPKSFRVQRGKKIYKLEGRPPFRNVSTSPMTIYNHYQSGAEKILAHPTAPDKLKQALKLVTKSIRIMVPMRLPI